MKNRFYCSGEATKEWNGKEIAWRVSVNYSDILTELIQNVGRFVESYASDFLITWNHDVYEALKIENIENIETKNIFFGLRDSGVDHYEWIKGNIIENGSYYYRKIFKLAIVVTAKRENHIDFFMELVKMGSYDIRQWIKNDEESQDSRINCKECAYCNDGYCECNKSKNYHYQVTENSTCMQGRVKEQSMTVESEE